MKVADIFKNKGFLGLFVSQVTGAFNDNALKMILVGIVLAVKPVNEHDSYLALLNALLIIPFVVFSPVAGWFSDRFSKRNVLITFKATEFLILGLVVSAVFLENLWILFLLLLMMGAQSAFYSPAKYGILKEITQEKKLGQANGIIEMGTILAIIAGTVGGAFLYDIFKSPGGNQSMLKPLLALGLASFVGLIFTLRIDRVSSQSEDTFNLKGFWNNLIELKDNRVLKLTVIGICYFWFAAMLLNLLLILFGTQTMRLKTVSAASILFLYLCVGVAIGSWIAAKASRYKVELGLIPGGSIGMGLASILLPSLATDYSLVVLDLIILGIFSGMFLVPLNTLLQIESGDDKRGRFIAITNMFTNLGMLFSSLALILFSDLFNLTPSQILFALGLFSFGVSIYIFNLLPEAFFSLSLGILTHAIYRIKSVDSEKVPEHGGVLLTPNHMSFVDALVLQYSVPQRKVRFIVDREYYNKPVIGWFLKMAGCIPVSTKAAKDAIIQAAAALDKGEVVCIFPEGSITRIGCLLPFKKGIELILRKAPEDTKVIPVCFDKLWGSIFSFKKGKFFWKIPERLPYPVTVLFGEPLTKQATAFELRQRVSKLSSEAFSARGNEFNTLPVYFIKSAKRFFLKKAVVDISEKPLTYLKLLTSSILVSREIIKRGNKNEMIGLMLPASVVGVIANIAIGLSGNIAVNLNFKAGEDSLNKAITKCNMKTIITSKLFVKKAGLNKLEQFIYIEDILKNIRTKNKLAVLISVVLLPSSLLKFIYYKNHGSSLPHDIATIIFSSGSTGDPKGVMLSHSNIISNGEMVNQVLHLKPYDRMLGSLPFFHSFGYTITLWFPLLKGVFTAYVPDPLDARKVGEMVEKYKTTIMLGTPTFYSIYTRKCQKEQFSYLRLAIAGAERLRSSIADDFFNKFGSVIVEGYGATEMSPVISCNVPDYQEKGIFQQGTKSGSVGIPLPGLSAKVVSIDNYDLELPANQEGMLLVNGPNRMIGYLHDKERTQEVLHNNWYVTGDIARIDEEGFIFIVGRLSRFSKIAGEMVSHVQVERTLNQVLGFKEQFVVVTSAEDKAKGEKLVVLYLPEASAYMTPKIVSDKLKEAGLPGLWVPREFYEVKEFPLLASGKIDLRALSTTAKDLVEKRDTLQNKKD